jgi:hypothetical protein
MESAPGEMNSRWTGHLALEGAFRIGASVRSSDLRADLPLLTFPPFDWQWLNRGVSFPLTAAGPCRIHTGFPGLKRVSMFGVLYVPFVPSKIKGTKATKGTKGTLLTTDHSYQSRSRLYTRPKSTCSKPRLWNNFTDGWLRSGDCTSTSPKYCSCK